MNVQFKRAEVLIGGVIYELQGMLGEGEENISSFFDCALNDKITALTEAKVCMALGTKIDENKEKENDKLKHNNISHDEAITFAAKCIQQYWKEK